MKRLIVCVMAFIAARGYAQDMAYKAMTIPDSVRKNASVVKRYEKVEFEVKDIERATHKVHQIFTVLHENGKSALQFAEHINRYTELEDFEARVFDYSGKQITKYKKKDLQTTVLGGNLIDDAKLVYLEVSPGSYPVTVEYKYELREKQTLFFPRYHILSPGMAVEASEFIAKIPKEIGLRFKEKNIKLSPIVTDEGNSSLYKWSVKNLSPFKDEDGAVHPRHRYPAILFAPNKFKYDKYEGDLSSWKGLGTWFRMLEDGLDELPGERVLFFKELVRNAATEKEKVKILYKYLQNNFRYVSIQLGIGGFQPFSAKFTDEKKYGDCKALTNYMKASLKAVGINSYPAIINAGEMLEPMDPNFPSQMSNHVILCVPLKEDSIWLECTNKTSDFGVLGNFTENRNALLITENGGVLVSTPRSKYQDNVFAVYTLIDLQEDGSAKTNSVISTSGEYKQEVMHYMFEQDEDDKKRYIINYLGYKQPDELSVSKKEDADTFKSVIDMRIEKVPQFVAGSKMFFSPRIYKLWDGKLPKSENRKFDYYFECPFEKSDTTQINLPAGFKPDALPKDKNLECEYASYSTKYWYDESKNALFSSAKLILKEYKIPAAKYAAVKKFFDDVLQDDNERMVVKK
jgi:hypothetical protein